MIKKFRFPALALMAAMVVAVPTVTLADDGNDHRGRDSERQRQEVYRDGDRGREVRDRDDYRDRDRYRDEARYRVPDRDDRGWHRYDRD